MNTNYNLKDIQELNQPTNNFLVQLENNVYDIKFLGFKMRDTDTNEIFHQFTAEDKYQLDYFASNILEYDFPHKVLKCKTIGTDLNFCVGDKPVKDLDFIEKHYLDGDLVKSYEFKFPFYMPNSTNSIEFIYPVPKLDPKIEEKIKNKEDVRAFSDTFILVEGKLVIHRRASYVYSHRQ